MILYIPGMPFPKTHRFRGTLYRLYWRKPPLTRKERTEEHRGLHKTKLVGKIYPEEPGCKPAIYIDPKSGENTMDALEFVDSIYHEGMHAAFPDLDEVAITEATTDIWTLLKRMGIQVSFKNFRCPIN